MASSKKLDTSFKEINALLKESESKLIRVDDLQKKLFSEKPNLSYIQEYINAIKQYDASVKTALQGAGDSSFVAKINGQVDNLKKNASTLQTQFGELFSKLQSGGAGESTVFSKYASSISKIMEITSKMSTTNTTFGDNTFVNPASTDKVKALNDMMRGINEQKEKIASTKVDLFNWGREEAMAKSYFEGLKAKMTQMQDNAVKGNRLDKTLASPQYNSVIEQYKNAETNLLSIQNKIISGNENIQRSIQSIMSTDLTKYITDLNSSVARYNENTNKISSIRSEQYQLNFKKDTGAISDTEYQKQQVELINRLREAKENIAKIDITTEEAERKMNAEISTMVSLWQNVRTTKEQISQIDLKEQSLQANGLSLSREEASVRDTMKAKLSEQTSSLTTLQAKYGDVKKAQDAMNDQRMADNLEIVRKKEEQQNQELQKMARLWESVRSARSKISQLNAAESSAYSAGLSITKEEVQLRDLLIDKMYKEQAQLSALQQKYQGNASANAIFQEQQIRDKEREIELNEKLAKSNVTKVTLGSTSGDVTSVSAAYRQTIKLSEEYDRLIVKKRKLNDELLTRTNTPEDMKALQAIEDKLIKIQKDKENIANTPIFAQAAKAGELEYSQKAIENVRKEAMAAKEATSEWALANSATAKTYDQYRYAQKNIQSILTSGRATKEETIQLQAELKRVSKEIDKIEGQTKTLKASSSQLFSIVNQLAMGFGVFFSLQSITQFITKMVQVTGEFELQHVALTSIIQDSRQANEIWNETIANALKSPFSVKSLVTYTKQLAAYRIENEKLVDTTKRLADISAGLGIDMQRLILAYGQVKAANYLRASEVRQFTEAGVNMYGELSKYFSEIQNTAVSTADVVQMVSKRMVKFEDVEEVFKRMTDQGGIFYNMQEIQSETVKGQIMKLHDAWDIMMNDIGSQNKGFIKSSVSGLLNITKHWEDVWAVMKQVLIAAGSFVAWFKILIPLVNKLKWSAILNFRRLHKDMDITSVKLKGLRLDIETMGGAGTTSINLLSFAFKKLGTAIGTAAKAVWSFTKANAVFLILTAAVEGLMWAFRKLREESERKLKLQFSDELVSAKSEADDLSASFENLAKKATNATNYKEQKDAIDHLHQAYGDILPDYMLEYDWLVKNTGAYGAATEAINKYTTEKHKQETLDTIKSETNEEASEYIEKIEKKLTNAGLSRNQSQYITTSISEYLSSSAEKGIELSEKQIANKIKEFAVNVGVESGFADDVAYGVVGKASKLSDAYVAGAERKAGAEKAFSDSLLAQDKLLREHSVLLDENIKKVEENAETYQKLSNRIIELSNSESKRKNILKDIEKLQSKSERTNTERHELKKLNSEYEKLPDYTKELANAKRQLAEMNTNFGVNADASMDIFEVNEAATNQKLQIYENYKKWIEENIARIKGKGKTVPAEIEKALQDVNNKIELIQNDWTVDYNKKLKNMLEKNVVGISGNMSETLKNRINDMYAKTSESVAGYAARLKTLLDDTKKDMEIYLTNTRLFVDTPPNQWFNSNANIQTPYVYSQNQQVYNVGSTAHASFTGESENKSGSKAANDRTNERISLIKTMASEYEKLAKSTYSAGKAADYVKENYKKAFFEIYKGKNASAVWKEVGKYLDDVTKGTISLKEATAKMLEEVKKYGYVSQKAMSNFLKEVSSQYVENETDKVAKERTNISDEINKMINQYKEYDDLVKSGFTKDFIFEITGEEQTSIKDMYKKLEDYKTKAVKESKWSEETEEMYKKSMENIRKIENDALKEQLKDYYKYFKTAMSEREKLYYEQAREELKINETFNKQRADNAVEIENLSEKAKNSNNIDEVREIRNEINERMKLYKMYNQQQEEAIAGSAKKYAKKSDELAWKDFKDSGYYESLFENVDKLPTDVLDNTLSQIQELKGSLKNLSASELKDIESQIEKIQSVLDERRPIKAFVNNMKTIAENYKNIGNVKDRYNELSGRRTSQLSELDSMEKKLANMKVGTTDYTSLQGNVIEKKAQIKETEQDIEDTQKTLTKYYKALYDSLDETEKFVDSMSAISGFLTTLGETVHAIGKDSDNIIQSSLNKVGMLVTNISRAATDAVRIVKNTSDISAWIDLLATVVDLVKSLAQSHDNALDDQIEKYKTAISEIEYRITKLGDVMKKALDSSEYMSAYNSSLAELGEKYENIKKSYNAEKSKKNPDDNTLSEYQQQLDGILDSIEQAKQEMQIAFGGIGADNYQSQASSFVDSWLSAFKETEDGLDGLQDSFDSLIENTFKKQATMKIAAKYLEPLFSMLDSYTEETSAGGTTITPEEIQKLREAANTALPELSSLLQTMFDGLDMTYSSTDSLSGLQKGISSITEATAEVIEGYLNSIRFYVAESTNSINAIRDAIAGGGNMYNPTVAELKNQTIILNKIHGILSAVNTPNQRTNALAVRLV